VLVANYPRSFQQEIQIQGLPRGTYGIQYSTPEEKGAELTEVTIAEGGTLSTTIPDRSLVTVHAKSPLVGIEKLSDY